MNQPTSLANGRYLLVKQLGEGGMATVYRAYDQRLQVWRAVKILSPEFAGKPKIARRFEAEAQTMALLEHRHIVRVYDVGHDGEDIAYIVMELLEGGCLVDWLESNGPMPPRMAVAAVIEVCDGLQAAHDKGVIHRDIKPHNILVTLDGVCRVTDFGIARVGDSDKSHTKTGSVMGTWGYMAPEQRTDAKSVDARADVYATGATLYSLLTERMPMDLFAAERNSSILDGVHEAIIPILIKATEYDRNDRYPGVREFKAALLEIVDQLPPIPEGTESLALSNVELPAPPDPAVFRPATDAKHLRTTANFDLSDATILPSDSKNMGGVEPTPTLLPTGEETRLLDDDSMPEMDGLTRPAEDIAVTVPGAVTRTSRPSGVSQAETLLLPGGHTTGAALPERAVAPPEPSSMGKVGVVVALLALLVALTTLTVVLFLVARPHSTTGTDQVLAEPAPVQPVEPAPVAPTPVAPEPVAPKPTVPEPVVPKPNPVVPKPNPVVPKPNPVVPKPNPVVPDPVVPQPNPVAPNPVVPQPVLSGRTSCVKPPTVTLNSQGNKVLFKVRPCEGNPSDYTNRVVVHYRAPGQGYVQHDLPARGANWVWGLPLGDTYKAGIEYYIDGWDASLGSANAPKTFRP